MFGKKLTTNAKKLLQDMELQEKEDEDETYIKKQTKNSPKIKQTNQLQPFGLYVKGKYTTGKEFQSSAA